MRRLLLTLWLLPTLAYAQSPTVTAPVGGITGSSVQTVGEQAAAKGAYDGRAQALFDLGNAAISLSGMAPGAAAGGTGGGSGVGSFNGRAGNVTLLGSDVTTALGYTAYDAGNPAGYLTTANINASLAAYAPLLSPAFVGTPTAPTAAPGTSTTQLATTAFVTAAVGTGGGGGGGGGTVTLASLGAYAASNPAGYQTASQVAATVAAASSIVNVSTVYTASGPIAPADSLSIVNATSAVAMTLASGVSGHQIIVKRYGTGAVSLTAVIDGKSQTITMNSAAVQESVTLLWSASLASYVLI